MVPLLVLAAVALWGVSSAPILSEGAVREYFIQAESSVYVDGSNPNWDYAPSGIDQLTGRSLDSSQEAKNISYGLVSLISQWQMKQPATWMKRRVVEPAKLAPFLERLSLENNPNGNGGLGELDLEGLPEVDYLPRVGRRYKKILLRAYTNETFTERADVALGDEHLGFLAPTLRAEVGDTIRVTFKNAVRTLIGPGVKNLALSLSPHSLFTPGGQEGAPYLRNSSLPSQTLNVSTAPGIKANRTRESARQPHRRAGIHIQTQNSGDSVYENGVNVYEWDVPERSGPSPNDPSSVAWFYHSHVDTPADTNSVCVGVIVVTRKGSAVERADGGASPDDVDRELFLVPGVIDENASPMALQNIGNLFNFNQAAVNVLSHNEAFRESNLMAAINGFMYANLPGLTTRVGERVRWYVGVLGNERDVHGIHWHGNTFLHRGHRRDSIPLLPGQMEVVDMTPDAAGTWLLHCHTSKHVYGGMTALYEVAGSTNGTGLTSGPGLTPSTTLETTVGVARSDGDVSTVSFAIARGTAIGGALLVAAIGTAALVFMKISKRFPWSSAMRKGTSLNGDSTGSDTEIDLSDLRT